MSDTLPGISNREVILVDEHDNQIMTMNIWQAHKTPGVLHRAISVVLYNNKKELLIQQRSKEKPLWPLIWSNTFCTHPNPGESYLNCAVRRGKEELGLELQVNELEPLFQFQYQAEYSKQLSEHELDTVVVGKYMGPVLPNPSEAAAVKWIDLKNLQEQLIKTPDQFTPWFKLILDHPKFRIE